MNILLLGFGDLAGRLAPRVQQAGWQASALRRRPLVRAGVRACAGDARDPAVLARALDGQDVVVVTLTPGAYTEQAYQDSYVAGAQALAHALAEGAHHPARVIWVSSTQVYGEGNGDWVDEDSATAPSNFAGRSLLAAEDVVRSLPVPTTIVRFTGIYGPGRTRLIEQVRAGHCAPSSPVVWTNRIHSEDCAGVLHHLLTRQAEGRPVDALYLGTDDEPTPLHEVHLGLARLLGVTPEPGVPAAAPRGNRRCRNDRLLASGYRFLYPSWRDGYGALLDQTT